MANGAVVTDGGGVRWRVGPSGALEAEHNGLWRDDHPYLCTPERVRLLAALLVTACPDADDCGTCDACVERSVAHAHYEQGYADGQAAAMAAGAADV